MIKRLKRNTNRFPIALEHTVENLISLGFDILSYTDYRYFEEEGSLPTDYVVRAWPHMSLWGTQGKKEALIVTNRSNVEFIRENGSIRIILEAKYQNTSGSVDEKIPYIWLAFQASTIPNWIVVYDGKFWLTPRGKAAIQWLKNRVAENELENRTIRICNRREFAELSGRAWR